jgi:GntR family transcriptional repressor for pyruvate dehydrogenase complex
MINKYATHKKKLYEDVIDQFLKMLSNGEYNVGDKLPSLPQLSDMFEVGKQTLREALSVLSSAGVVEIRHGKGIFVKRLTLRLERETFNSLDQMGPQEFRHWLEFRRTIEVEAIGLAAQRRNIEDIDRIQETMLAIEESIMKQGVLAPSLDYEFHIRIASASHNPFFAEALKNHIHLIQQQYFEKLSERIEPERNREMLVNEHRKMCEFIKNGDMPKSRNIMGHHIDTMLKRIEIMENV